MTEELVDALAEIGSNVQLEVRPTDQTGYWIRVERGSGGSLFGELVTITYYVPGEPHSPERLSAIRSAGWRPTRSAESVNPAAVTHRRSWPKGSRRAQMAKDIAGLIELIGLTAETADVLVTTALPGPVSFPHAISFWDYKEDPPRAECSEAATRLVAVGARAIQFSEPDTGGGTSAVVVAPRPLSLAAGESLWNVSVREMPSSGGRLVTWRC